MLKQNFFRWIRWLLLCALVGLILVISPEPADSVALSTLQRGTDLATAGSRTLAEEAYQNVIARRPRDPQPWQQLGDLYLAWGRPDKALHAYGQAIRRGDKGLALDRGLAQLYLDLAQLYLDFGSVRQALDHWTRYLARRPEERAARLMLAQSAIRLADWERARAELEHLIAYDPADAVAHAWLGLLLIGPERDVGMSNLQRAAQDPFIAEWIEPIFTAERLAAAQDPAYRSALLGAALLELDIPRVDVNVQQAAAQREVTSHRQAIATLALRSLLAATFRDPGYADAYAYLGQAFDRLELPGWAWASLKKGLSLAPQSPVVLTLAGLYWDRHGEPAQARHYYETALGQDQNNAALGVEIAGTYAAEGEYTASEVWLQFATNITPDDPAVWEALARFYLELGIDAAASGLEAATRLLELTPDNARAHDLMGWAFFLNSQDAQAEASFRQALTLDPGLSSAHYHLGRLWARQGRHAQAVQAYQRARNLDIRGQLEAELDRALDDIQNHRGQP